MNLQQTLLSACLLLELSTFGSCVYNGILAEHGQYKHVVQIKHRPLKSYRTYVHCTGSILSPSWVVTAAHCVAGQEYSRLEQHSYLPDWESRVVAAHIGSDLLDEGREQESTATRTFIHPEAYDENKFRAMWDKWLTWDHKTAAPRFENGSFATWDRAHELAVTMGEGVDIALLLLEKPFEFNEWVGSIGWATEIPDTADCTVVGFGRSHDEGRVYYNEQNYISVRIGGGDFCKAVMPDGNVQYIRAHHICGIAVVPFGNVCGGDSGGPVVCGGVLYGVASKEPNTVTSDWCGEVENTPMYFTSTAGVKEWIVSTMEEAKPSWDENN